VGRPARCVAHSASPRDCSLRWSRTCRPIGFAAPARVSHLVLLVPGAGGLYSGRAGAPPRFALEALCRFELTMWLLMRLAPRFTYRLVGIPSSLIPSLTLEQRARLDEVVDSILPAVPRRLGLLKEGQTQKPGREYALERIAAPT
jgi:hypothetical protein